MKNIQIQPMKGESNIAEIKQEINQLITNNNQNQMKPSPTNIQPLNTNVINTSQPVNTQIHSQVNQQPNTQPKQQMTFYKLNAKNPKGLKKSSLKCLQFTKKCIIIVNKKSKYRENYYYD